MQIKKSPVVHDVVVIGSGASGGMVAWNLTRKGINVLLLDAGGRAVDQLDPGAVVEVRRFEWHQRPSPARSSG